MPVALRQEGLPNELAVVVAAAPELELDGVSLPEAAAADSEGEDGAEEVRGGGGEEEGVSRMPPPVAAAMVRPHETRGPTHTGTHRVTDII